MASSRSRVSVGKPFKISFTDAKTKQDHLNLEPVWMPSADGSTQSIILYIPDSTVRGGMRMELIASCAMTESKETLWDLAWTKVTKLMHSDV